MWATSTPSSASRSEIQGPLRSAIRPVRTSVPVTTIPARTVRSLIRSWAFRLLRAASARRRSRSGSRPGWSWPGRRPALPSTHIVTAPLPKAIVKPPERNGPASAPASRIWPSTSGSSVGVEQADPDFRGRGQPQRDAAAGRPSQFPGSASGSRFWPSCAAGDGCRRRRRPRRPAPIPTTTATRTRQTTATSTRPGDRRRPPRLAPAGTGSTRFGARSPPAAPSLRR